MTVPPVGAGPVVGGELASIVADGVYVGGGALFVILVVILLILFLRRG